MRWTCSSVPPGLCKMPQKGYSKCCKGGTDPNSRCIIFRAAYPVGGLCKVVTDERCKLSSLIWLILHGIWVRYKDIPLRNKCVLSTGAWLVLAADLCAW